MTATRNGCALIEALLEGNEKKALTILAGNVNFYIENRGDYAIHLAARRGSIKVISKMECLGADLEQRNLHGNTPIHYAAKGGCVDLAKYLSEKKVDMNILNHDGESPLHYAVKTQPMTIIEEFVAMGMAADVINKKTGETPLHIALKYGRQEAMEGLLVAGATTDIRDFSGNLPADVANTKGIRESFRTYAAMLDVLKSGCILCKDVLITKETLSKPLTIQRVGVIVEAIDAPSELPPRLYCRREKAENSTVQLAKYEGEHVFSDVFHIRVFDTNRACYAKMFLPLYTSPSIKEEMVLRFIPNLDDVDICKYLDKDRVVQISREELKANYCLLETTLVPDTTCVCVIYVRQKEEIIAVSNEGQVISSELENGFFMEVPPDCFEEGTQLKLLVYDSSTDIDINEDTCGDEEALKYIENVEAGEDIEQCFTEDVEAGEAIGQQFAENSDSANEAVLQQPMTSNDPSDMIVQSTTSIRPKPEPFIENESLLTDVYQISLSGQQPKKEITIQVPIRKDMKMELDDMVIVRADENCLDDPSQLEVLPVPPKLVNDTLIFEISHFSVYVASWKKKTAARENLLQLQTQMLYAREKRRAAKLFVVLKKSQGLRHIIVVECGILNRVYDRRQKWLENEFELQRPEESHQIMMVPGEIFLVQVEGNASLENEGDSSERQIQFSQCRPSFQTYRVLLHENIYDNEHAKAVVVVQQKREDGIKEIARFNIQLKAPPPPPPPPPPLPTPPPPSPPPSPVPSLLQDAETEIEFSSASILSQQSADLTPIELPIEFEIPTCNTLEERFTRRIHELKKSMQRPSQVDLLTNPEFFPERPSTASCSSEGRSSPCERPKSSPECLAPVRGNVNYSEKPKNTWQQMINIFSKPK